MVIIGNPSVLEALLVVLEIEKKSLLLMIVYLMLSSLGTLIDDSILLISELPTHLRILIVCNFSLDLVLSENFAKVVPLFKNFNLSQRSQYSSHIHRGFLDLGFDTSNSNAASSLPSPYTVQSALFFQIWSLYIYIYICKECSFQQFSFQSILHNV